MPETITLESLKSRSEFILTDNILPFWISRMQDVERGGFFGRIDGLGRLHPEAPKGAILAGRLLWSFSAAYRVLGKPEYLSIASRARDYLLEFFYDKSFGGVFWSLDCFGRPLDTKKQFYALGFAIYGLSEYHRATGDPQALDYAIRLFRSIEEHSYDPVYGGYFEACTRDWKDISDMRLSEKDANEKKTMNTHLHILEPYTNLYRVWKAPELREALIRLLRVFLDRIIDRSTHHLGLFFDEEWHRKDRGTSFGHDIEASWLLREAAEVLGGTHSLGNGAAEKSDGAACGYGGAEASHGHRVAEKGVDSSLLDSLTSEVDRECSLICAAAMEGYREDGSMLYEIRDDGSLDADRHWWVQAETVTGLLWEYIHTGEASCLERCGRALSFIEDRLLVRDSSGGTHATEWHWSVRADGTVNTADDLAGFWKCPYHNSRMCIEILEK